MAFLPDPRTDNRLIAALPASDWLRWRPHIERVELPLGKILYEERCTLGHVYFPADAIVSKLYVTGEGASSEVAVVGSEGMVGTALFLGASTSLHRAMVIVGGHGYRLSADVLLCEFEQSAGVAQLLLRYTQALITQMAQTAVCNRHHRLDMQLCRWLLMMSDRLNGNQMTMTQEAIAHLLGVRREGITEAALKLQKAGVISYTRGRITLLDRAALEQRSCECYGVVKREYDRLLPWHQALGVECDGGHRLLRA